MAIKSDKWIRNKVFNTDKPIISPFFKESFSTLPNGKKCPSYGLTSYGYDVRLGNEFKLFKSTDGLKYEKDSKSLTTNPYHTLIDPTTDFDINSIEEITCNENIILPPRAFCLGVSMERIFVPRDCIVTCMGKSSIARLGLHVIVTPLEPEWEGYITLEISNIIDQPIRLWAGMGITQLQFHDTDEVCETSYADRNGKYQNQPYKPVTSL